MASYSPTHSALVTDEIGLIREILRGRQDLFADLIGPHVKPLFHVIRRMVGQRQDVEDIVQQATLKALIHLAQFRAQASFKTWLVRIGLNEARQWQRGRSASRYVPLDLTTSQLAAADDRHCPSTECQRNEMAARLHSAAAKLPEKYRTVFHLLELEELSVAETAKQLGLNIATVKTRRMRARRRIVKLLNHRTPLRRVEQASRAA
jgi:RNA polymerase sigma-70 factor (ECF subfamily)